MARTSSRGRDGRQRGLSGLIVVVVTAATVAVSALALASTLATSKFEIDDVVGAGSNLSVQGGTGYLDWQSVSTAANVTAGTFRYSSDQSGADDNSFGTGTKEDTTVPAVVSGGIPPNKSDLKEFFAYTERVGTRTYLHLAWSRVQDPSGTTNMDFELNQSSLTHANGVPKRTQDDLLITYDLSKGGSTPVLGYREWNGDDTSGAWGPYTLFSQSIAIGSINEQSLASVTAPNGSTYGPYSPRTFGEAAIDLNEAGIFDPNECTAFGQAYLKSRSSDSFTSALKDYVAPVSTQISNCGRVVVHKTNSVGGGLLAGATFTISPSNRAVPPAGTVPAVVVSGQTVAGVFCIDKLLLGTQYTITEADPPPNFSGAAPQTFTPTVSGSCSGVTSATTANLTFVNTPLTGSILVKKTKSDGSVLGGATFGYRLTSSSGGFTSIPGVAGSAGWFCVDGLNFGGYTIRETAAPNGYNAAADQTHSVASSTTCAARTSPTLGNPDVTFVNNAAPGSITITKQDDATPPNPLPGVEFKLYTDAGNAPGVVYDADPNTAGTQALLCTTAALSSLTPGQCTISNIPLGTYWVVETQAPAGHTGAASQQVTMGLGTTPGTGQSRSLTFTNARTHKVIVLVCHQGTNTLAASAVTRDSANNTTSLAPTGLTAQQQADLCALSGATYSGLGHGVVNLTVTPGSAAHP